MLPERIRKPFARLFHWHLLHKGESVCHFLYLTATVIEGHGFHAIFAGGVAVFVIMSSVAFHRGGGGSEVE
jgi:hypothetical protein